MNNNPKNMSRYSYVSPVKPKPYQLLASQNVYKPTPEKNQIGYREEYKDNYLKQANTGIQGYRSPDRFQTTYSNSFGKDFEGSNINPKYSKLIEDTGSTKRYEIVSSSYFSNYNLPHLNSKSWEEISMKMKDLQRGKPSVDHLLQTIQSLAEYTTRLRRIDVSLLKEYLICIKDKQILQELIPFIAKLVDLTPVLFPKSHPIIILTQGHYGKVTLSRDQCTCLLANMFMCTTINQNNPKLQRDFNFSGLYQSTGDPRKDGVNIQKLACLFNYFLKRACTHISTIATSDVTFSRLVLKESIHGKWDLVSWKSCSEPLKTMKILSPSKIEDVTNAREVDFANKYLGGGVLASGSVQEEILFITRPELIVGMLFSEFMEYNEAILMRGAKIYSDYSGYDSTFTFEPESLAPRVDKFSEREVVAIDAIDFRNMPSSSQYSEKNLMRELNKAYVGFFEDTFNLKRISTGSWGCGVFEGNFELKVLIQWMAAARARREIVFNLQHPISSVYFHEIHSYYATRTVGEMLSDILICVTKNIPGKKMELFKELATYIHMKQGAYKVAQPRLY